MLTSTYQIVDYFNQNPGATAADAVKFFGEQFEIQQQIEFLKSEGREFARVRAELRPLWAQKRDADERIKYILGDIELEVMIKYPPRQGSDKDREVYRNELKRSKADFQDYDKQVKDLSDQITVFEHELDEVDRNAKNARRLAELYEQYIEFIMEYKKGLPVF